MDLEHPPLTEASRHQPGKPVPWGGLRKEPDGGLAVAQTMDCLQVHTQRLGPLLAPRGSPDHLIPVRIWEQCNFSPAYWKARKRGLLCESRHPTWTSRATPHINSSQTQKKKLGLAHGHLLPLQSRWVMPLMLLQHLQEDAQATNLTLKLRPGRLGAIPAASASTAQGEQPRWSV